MNSANVNKQTNVTGKVLTGDQAKARVYSMGMTLRDFANKKGLSYRVVSEVIRGVNKGLYGEGHKAAKALGMK